MVSPVRPEVLQIEPYVPGGSQAAVQRAFGLSGAVKLASNENALGPSHAAIQAARAACEKAHLYPDPAGTALRIRLADVYGLSADWILVGNGSDEILRLLAYAYVRDRDRAVVPACSFPNFRTVSLLAGAQICEVPLRDWTMDLSAMAAAAREMDARICFLCRPNNPTGAVFGEEEFRLFMAGAPSGSLIIVDEAYHEFDESRFNSLALLHDFPNLILTRTFSKAYGLAGFRIGYALARPEILEPLRRVREPFSVNLVAQEAALAALDDEQHLERSRALAREGREYLCALSDAMGLRSVPSQANFVLIDLGRPAVPVHEQLLKRGVIIRPCQAFGLPDHIRVTAGKREELERFAHALRVVLLY